MKKEENPTFISELSSAFGDRYLHHISLADYVFNKLGGVADHLVTAASSPELITAAKIALKYRVPYIVLGYGSASLVSDVGFPGLVIISKSQNIYFAEHLGQAIVDGGASNDEVVNAAAHRGLGGLEFLTHVPGTIGGAVMTKASYGRAQFTQYLREVMIFLPEGNEGKTLNVPADQLYHESSFFSLTSKTDFPPVILAARIQFVHLADDEVMRRLVRERKERVWDTRPRLGKVFDQELSAIIPTMPKFNKLRLTAIKIDRHHQDLLMINPKAKSSEVKKDLDLIKNFIEDNGHQLAERLSFIGYWPNEEENASDERATLNTESL